MKSFFKVFFILLLEIVIFWAILFGIDCYRANCFEAPLFYYNSISTSNGKTYDGIGYKVNTVLEQIDGEEKIGEFSVSLCGKTILGGIRDFYTKDNEILDQVVIENGVIYNEELLDEFIQNVGIDEAQSNKLVINCDNNLIELTFTPGECVTSQDKTTLIIPNSNSTDEEFKNYYGYYTLNKDGFSNEYRADAFSIARKVTNSNVIVYFKTNDFIEISDFNLLPQICIYDINSSLYKKDFELSASTNNSNLIKIYEDDISIYTYNTDVNITFENDMVYSLKDSLENDKISIDDIISQCQLDAKYGFCKGPMLYQDGGSIEYYYDDFTVLKLNTIDGKKDVIIGSGNGIINLIDVNAISK